MLTQTFSISFSTSLHYLLIITLALVCGAFHSYHVATLFENSRHFSHLSTLEREMNFRTEMGLYYSYFKTMVESPSLREGLHAIMNDNLTEYPNSVNTLKRFNLYPEVLLSVIYQFHEFLMDSLGIPSKQCWQVNRGEVLPPVESCEGLGDKAYFYVSAVWIFSSLTTIILFLYGKLLSQSIIGGLLAVMCFFYNHAECTRVQWTPPLRESFGYPVFLTHMFIISIMLRQSKVSWRFMTIISLLTIIFVLFWQFAPFALLTQLLAVFSTYILHLTSSHTMKRYIVSLMLGLVVSCVLQFWNEMLVSSLLTACLPAAYFVVTLEEQINKIRIRPLAWVVQGVIFLFGTFSIKNIITYDKHDAHIWSLLRSKFSSYSDFHTLLYTCSPEFDFMERETPWRLTETCLLPVSIFIIAVVSSQIIYWELKAVQRKLLKQVNKDANKDVVIQNHENAEIVYNMFQLGAFAFMAIIIMRLKLFFTPHLCLLVSLLCSNKFFAWLKTRRVHLAIIIGVIAVMSVNGIKNLKEQLNIIGEYSNADLEELLSWVNRQTPKDAVFAGPMPTMANLMLSTRRAIVNHPHYEDYELRLRTKKVYSLYSRKSVEEVYQILKRMGVHYALLEEQYCFRASREGCTMLDLWDLEDPENHRNTPFCVQVLKNSSPFQIVFKNSAYTVLFLPRVRYVKHEKLTKSPDSVS